MSVLFVPTSSDPFYDQITSFEGVDYLLTFRYNQREDAWYLSIATAADGVSQIEGIKLVTNWPLLAKRRAGRTLPPGDFLVVTNDDTNDAPPGLSELGEGLRCELTYFTADEL